MKSALFAVLVILSLSIVVSAQNDWFGRGSYTRSDLADPETIYNIQRCNELLPETLSIDFIDFYYDYETLYGYVFQYKLNIGQTHFLVYSQPAVPRFDDSFTLTNGRTVPGAVYIIYDGVGSFLTHIFLDTTSFRSANPSSPDFVEKEVCQVVFVQDALPTAAKQATTPPQVNRVAVRDDPCAILQVPGSVVGLNDALACMRSVPFSTTTRNLVVDTLEDIMAFYIFKDTNSDVLYGDDRIQLDIMAEIDRISGTTYNSDLEMHEDINAQFIQARDGHTQWTFPQCYLFWKLFQPFGLSSYVELDGNQVIVIDGAQNADVYLELYDIEISAFIGYIVDEIDGQDAVQHLLDYADEWGTLKDRASRFNAALNDFTFRLSILQGIPEESTVSWTLRNPATGETIEINFDWLVELPGSGIATNGGEFADWCTTLNQDFACGNTQKSVEIRTRADVTVASYDSYSLEPLNSEVGILRIPDFASSFGYEYTYYSFAVLYLTSIHTYNFDRLIIDVSNNGGGFGYTGIYLAGLVIPSITDSYKLGNSDIIQNDLMDFTMDFIYNNGNQTLLDSIVNGGSIFANPSVGMKGQNDPDGSWYFDSNRITRGGHTSDYSDLVESSWFEDTYVDDALADIHGGFEYITYPEEDIQILTNGNCFSTCAIFVRAVVDFGGAEAPLVVGWGGLIGEPLDSSESPTEVLNLLYIKAQFDSLSWMPGMPVDLIPQPFPYVTFYECFGGYFQISYSESYDDDVNPKKKLPNEYKPNPVACRLNVWEQGTELYSQAAYAFYYCPNSDFRTYATETESNVIYETLQSSASVLCGGLVLLIVTLLL